MPGGILLHLTFLPNAACASVGRLYFFFRDCVSFAIPFHVELGDPARSCGRIPVILVKSMKNHSWCLRQPSPKTVTTLYHAPQSSFEVWIPLSTCSTITKMRWAIEDRSVQVE